VDLTKIVLKIIFKNGKLKSMSNILNPDKIRGENIVNYEVENF